jgi:protein-tyrosine-phosphatase
LKFHGSDKYNVRSCGTGKAAYKNAKMPRRMRVLLGHLGYDGEGHRSQPITEELLEWADVVVTMANAHIKYITAHHPATLDKVEPWFVDDPHFSSDPAVHGRVIDELRAHVLDRFC